MKIRRLEINSFRGIPGKCSFSFSDKSGACSAIIYGGNGSGKSSIVDSIEFCLQSRIGRSKSLRNPQRPKPYNLSLERPAESSIWIEFNDGTSIRREIKNDYKGGYMQQTITPKDPCDLFNYVPVVLRRSDLIAFNSTKEAERQVLLSQFLYGKDWESKLADDPEIAAIEDQILGLRNSRREKIKSLSALTKITEIDLEENINLTLLIYVKSRITSDQATLHKQVNRSGEGKHLMSKNLYAFCLKLATECDTLSDEIKGLHAQVNGLRKIERKKINPLTKHLQSVFDKSSEYLTSSFRKISNADYVKDIRLQIGTLTAASFNIHITLSNGTVVSPSDIFSEANYDLMVLLLYLSIIRVGVDNGQPPILILDDVLQSVDSTIRTNFVDYLLTEMPNWQLFFTCHDRLWLEQLKYLFNRRSHRFKEFHIVGWSFESGPSVKEMKAAVMDDTLKDALSTHNPHIIAAVSGAFLERICNELSVSLGCSVMRVRGDKYTLGDLWPSVVKAMRKTELKDYVDKVDHLLYIRNLFGCHYNEWAQSMSDEEIVEFANGIQDLYEKVFCHTCFSWIHRIGDGGLDKACNCGCLSYK